MKAPDRITTIAIATKATVLLSTVAFALAGPPMGGPSDSDLPVISTPVMPGAESATEATVTAPLPPAEDDEDDADDRRETVSPKVRIEDPDEHDDDKKKDGKQSEDDKKKDEKPSDDDDHDDGESSESTKTDEPR